MNGSRITHPEARRWPDMELLLYKQDEQLFYGSFPTTLDEVSRRLDLARGADYGLRTLRRFEDPSVLGTLSMHRIGDMPETTEDAHKWASRLVNLMCKPESQKILDDQENLPSGTYEKSDFLRSMVLQRNPKALLEQLRYWLLADAVDLHYDWFNLALTCTEIWNTILAALRGKPTIQKQPVGS